MPIAKCDEHKNETLFPEVEPFLLSSHVRDITIVQKDEEEKETKKTTKKRSEIERGNRYI